MDNENNDSVESSNDTVVETVETQDEATPEVDPVKLQESNKRLFGRTKRAEERVKTLEARLKALEGTDSKLQERSTTPDESITKDIAELKTAEKKRQIGYRHGLSPEETDKLFAFAGQGDPEEAMKDPFFQAGLKEFRRSQRAKDAIPSSTNRSSKVDGKTFSEMTDEERAKNWDKFVVKK